MSRVNLESITFLKVRKIMYLDKAYIIVKRNVYALLRNKQKYKYTNNMQVMLMRLMSKGEYLIVPKGTKFTGAGKLGLIHWVDSECKDFFSALFLNKYNFTVKHFKRDVRFFYISIYLLIYFFLRIFYLQPNLYSLIYNGTNSFKASLSTRIRESILAVIIVTFLDEINFSH